MENLIFVNDNNPSGARGMARYFRYALDGIISHYGNRVLIFSPSNGNYGSARHIHPLQFKGSEQIALHEKLATLTVWRTHPSAIFSAWFTAIPTDLPQAFVFYDMILERFPHLQPWYRVPLRNLIAERKRSLERADRVVAISQSTATDIISFYPRINPAKIVIIPLGVSPFFLEATRPRHDQAAKPYFLYVGFRTGHKNFLRLLTAYGQSGLAKEFNLRVISHAPLDVQERDILRQYQLQDNIQMVHDADENELRRSYSESIAFVYPSVYEGFGLPILEAMACGTIVITSNTSSMPEVGGEAALYFDPNDVEAIAAALRRAVNLSTLEREQRITAGVARARTFTWERCQQQTVALIEKLIRGDIP
jgi:glycosyltransferase involved in cell wall biosynthesis